MLPLKLVRASQARRGVLLRKDLKAAKVSYDAARRMVRKGVLLSPHAHVYVNPAIPDSWERQMDVLVLGLRAIAARRSAARLWGLLPDTDVLEVAVTTRRRIIVPGVVVFRCSDLRTYRPVVRDGILTMHPLQMLVHLGAVLPQPELIGVISRGLVADLFTLAGAAAALQRLGKPGRDGTVALRHALARFRSEDAKAESVLEMFFHFLSRDFALPEPTYQHWILDHTVRLDAAYPEWKIAIEVDGWDKRTGKMALDWDDARQNRVVLDGWLILRFTADRIEFDAAGVAAEIKDALRTRGALV